jgi:hypothetical protein
MRVVVSALLIVPAAMSSGENASTVSRVLPASTLARPLTLMRGVSTMVAAPTAGEIAKSKKELPASPIQTFATPGRAATETVPVRSALHAISAMRPTA